MSKESNEKALESIHRLKEAAYKAEYAMDRQDELEPIDHPRYYGGRDDPYEAIKVIEAWDLDFCLGNAVKYISRWKEKGGVNDLKKAVWYVNRRIQQLENEHKEEA